MIKRLLAMLLVLGWQAAHALPVPCSSNPVSGTLTLSCFAVRTTGVSPLLVFFDCNATTDTGLKSGATVHTDVSFTWVFGDLNPNSGGASTWAYGSNPGKNLRNVASGPEAAHLYVVTDGAGDQKITAQVWATDKNNNSQTCTLAVTVYDPAGSNGYPGTATTCVSSSGTPVAGVNGCPAGAVTPAASSSFFTPTAGRRILYKCGDSFSGGTVNAVANWSVGAYGNCKDTPITASTTASYPQFSSTISINTQASDGRVSDLVLNTGANPAVTENNAYDPPYTATTQITLNNLWSKATNQSYYVAQASQQGYIGLVQTGMGVNQGTFVNYAQNNCANPAGSSTYPCTTFVPSTYTAMLGGSYDGTGAPDNGNGIETVRVSACRMCIFSNNTIKNANNVGAVFKLHGGNTKNTSCEWIGQWTENVEISDNLFSGKSGAELVETVAQNPVTDERLRNLNVERNLFSPTTSGHQLLAGAMNEAVRTNVFQSSGASMGQRGFQGSSNNTSGGTCTGSGTTTAPVINPYPTGDEFENNTCFGGSCGAYGTNGLTSGATSSFARNNLIYQANLIAAGTGNTVNSNSPNNTSNPAFVNGSTTLSIITDFTPTANFSGATTVDDVFFDACTNTGFSWTGNYILGALSRACP